MQLNTAWLDPALVGRALALTTDFLRPPLAGPAATAARVAAFLAAWDSTLAPSRIAWTLAAAVLDTPPDAPPATPDAWPLALVARPGGAALQWACSQVAGRSDPMPAALAAFPPLLPAQAALVAHAWARWPATPALCDPAARATFVAWLRSVPAAAGWLAVALAAAAGPDLAAATACLAAWSPPTTADALLVLTDFPPAGAAAGSSAAALDAAARAALAAAATRRAAAATLDDLDDLAGLCHAAFAHGWWAEAFALADRLRTRLPDPAAAEFDALAIAALAQAPTAGPAARAAARAAAAAYRTRWCPTGRLYPLPHLLLPALQLAEAPDLAHHLLQHAVLSDAPKHEWVRLEQLDDARRPAESLPGWLALFLRTVSAGGPPLLPAGWVARLGSEAFLGYVFERLTAAVIGVGAAGPPPAPNEAALLKAACEQLVPQDVSVVLQRLSYSELLKAAWEQVVPLGADWALIARSVQLLLQPRDQGRHDAFWAALADARAAGLDPLRAHPWVPQAARRAVAFALAGRQAFRLRDFFAVYDPAVFRRVAGYAEVALVEALDTLARYEAAGAWGRWLRTWRAITTLPLSPDLLAAAITQFEAARQSLPRRAPRLARSARLTDLARRLQLYAVALCERAAASGPGAAGAWQSTALPPGALAAYLPLLRDLAAAPDPLPGG